MGLLSDQLPPNVSIVGNPPVTDTWDRTMNGIDIAQGAANAISGRSVGGITLGGAVASTAFDEMLARISAGARSS